ncbi:MAG: cupin domain-containing protein [Candidatus Eisenbacteria bacterium]|nr:cupin domain-containing protein [Candidatus Eisenbacteria bacterium]
MTADEKIGPGESAPRVAVMADLVAYQVDSVVSRTVVKKPAGTITVFAFDRGQALSEHSAPFDALVQVLDGRAEITIAGEPFAVAAGELLLLPANRPHAVRAAERFKMVLTMIRS